VNHSRVQMETPIAQCTRDSRSGDYSNPLFFLGISRVLCPTSFAPGVESEQSSPWKVQAVKVWPWKFVLISVGWLMLVAGIAPGAYILVRLGNSGNQKPMSVPVSLKQGEFASPYFTPDSSKNYVVSLAWDTIPARQTSLDLDWKLVAENGAVIQRGTFLNLLRGANAVALVTYNPKPGQRQQVVLNVHTDVDQGGAQARLEVGPAEENTSLSEKIPSAAGWAAFVALPGALLLIVIAIFGARSGKKSTAQA